MFTTKTIFLMAIIALFLLPLSLFANPANSAFSVSRSHGNSLQLRFELPRWSLEDSSKEADGSKRVSIGLPDLPYLYLDETQTLPVFSTCIAIPYRGGAELSLLNSASHAHSRVTLDFDADLQREKAAGRFTESLYPASTVTISEPMVIRDFRIVTLNVYPFQYDPGTRQLYVNQSIDISLNFNSLPSVNEMEAPANYSSVFDGIYRGLILNYDSFRDRNLSFSSPRMLVIHGNSTNQIFLGKVNDYVDWKRQRGFIVNTVSTATTGTTYTAIKTYIQNLYNNTDTRPDYIVLIGDTSGNMPIPTQGSYTDYYYTHLAGNDTLGDAIIGRISVETPDQMINYMAKIASYEQNLNINTAAFLNRMLLVADTAQSGISTVYTSRYIEDIATPVNPDYNYVEIFGSPSTANINTAINQGVAFYNYRGYIGMSGWPSTMSSMNNLYRMFHAVFLTCSTGDFGSGTSTTESVVRYGTSSTMGGAITAIGMATASTATPQNNCLNHGIFHSIFNLGYRDMGAAMLYGKLYLHAVYGVSNSSQAINFANYCNLIGDPSAAVYAGIPSTFNLSVPATIPAGAAHLQVSVKDQNNVPVYGASVVLSNTDGSQIIGYSDASGSAILDLPSTLSGSYNLSVNKDDFKTAVSTLSISTTGSLIYDGITVDDDNSGASSGNANAMINSGETIELYIKIKNTTAVQHRPGGTLTLNDPYLSLINPQPLNFGRINAGELGQNLDPIILSVAPNTPDNYHTYMRLDITSSLESFLLYVPLLVRGPHIEILSHSFVGAAGNVLSPGQQFPMNISIKNSGLMNLSAVSATLRSLDPYVSIVDSLGSFGNINVGQTVSNSMDNFSVSARVSAITGMIIPLRLSISSMEGYAQQLDFEITLGQSGLNHPLGQDAYGYFIFDDGDTGYQQCPSYQWIGIAPAEGGSGTALNLSDPGSHSDEGDQNNAVSIQTVNLPFSFKFYGRDYSSASISSNGFIAFGQTTNSDWRNWRLPDAGGPSQMIAVFWDDLELDSGSGVYTYFDNVQHYYVVEWYNLRAGYDRNSIETFQAILYDPIYYPTHTGDGQIKLQYKTIANIDTGASEDHYPHANYATVGIEDHTSTIGLEYTFNNTYPNTCKPLTNNMALLVTTRPILSELAYLQIEDVTVSDPNSNGILEPGETASILPKLINYGMQDALAVTAILSSTDPFVTIHSSQIRYGNIPSQNSALPLTGLSVSVSSACPSAHAIPFTLNIYAANSSWERTFVLHVYAAEFSLEHQTVSDTGNHNGILDPGETASISYRLYNRGRVAAAAGTATLSCLAPGISINTPTSSFASIAPEAYATISFSVSASSGMSTGTLVSFDLNVSSELLHYQTSVDMEIGAPLVVLIGSGTSSQTYPFDRYYNYSVHESIYLASEIGMGGLIKSVSYYKASGNDVDPISPVSIYMKNITANSLSTGAYSLTGYTLVYEGSFSNTATSGWMEVNLDTMYQYDGITNLSILIVKNHQQWISYYPYYSCSTTSGYRARQNRSDSSLPSSLSASNNLPNLRLRIFPEADLLLPPSGLSALPSHQSVRLSWNAPATGSPSTYKIYRNNSLLSSVAQTSYTDLAVINGSTYTYYVTAVYEDLESEASEIVSATPNALPPTNLSAQPANRSVTLSWNGPQEGREQLEAGTLGSRLISSYRIYRDGSPIATISQTSYEDTNLRNGVTYSYYVTTIYTNPAGESAASQSVSATPVSISFAILGSGTAVSSGGQNSPLNICNNSVHGQMVFTAAELNQAGLSGPMLISGMGFYVLSSPNLALPSFVVRMKHTSANVASDWQSEAGMQNCYTNASYMPNAGGWDMLSFDTPFEWNGTDNILIDTAFGVVDQTSQSGTLQYTAMTNGYRFAWSNTADQTNVFTGGLSVARRYNVRLAVQELPLGPGIEISHSQIGFGNVELGEIGSVSFSIQNTGEQNLIGTIDTPEGFSVSPAGRNLALNSGSVSRNLLNFDIPAAESRSYTLVFTPIQAQDYSGNMTINSNASDNPAINIPLSGTGQVTSLQSPQITITLQAAHTQISWSAIPFATSYLILRADSPEGPFTQIGNVTSTQFTDQTAPPKAFYRIKANR